MAEKGVDSVRIQVAISPTLLKRIDDSAAVLGMSRSAWLSMAAGQWLSNNNLVAQIPSLLETANRIADVADRLEAERSLPSLESDKND